MLTVDSSLSSFLYRISTILKSFAKPFSVVSDLDSRQIGHYTIASLFCIEVLRCYLLFDRPHLDPAFDDLHDRRASHSSRTKCFSFSS